MEHSGNGSGGAHERRARAWLSRSLCHLFDRHLERYRRQGNPRESPPPPHFDVLIIGSGYGGAVAAATLAGARLESSNGHPGRPLQIAVLERGNEYLPGAFPSQLSELPGHVRFSLSGDRTPHGVRTGLFDVRVSPDVVSVVANGLGGGSLINAGVMLPASEEVLAEARWPEKIRSNPKGLTSYYDRAARWLGAGSREAPNTVKHAGVVLAKHDSMVAAGGDAVPITVALKAGTTSSAGVKLNKCVACGDCATGCNVGAKHSLDVNLLVQARYRGVQIYTGATVLRLERVGARWSVVVNHTDAALRQRQREPLRIEADKVILAAGTFGSTEILMRSREALRLSSQLGRQFSGNGDLFAAAYDVKRQVNAVADDSVAPGQRDVGPTITTAITAPIDNAQRNRETVSIQELAVPGALRRLFEEIFTTARTLHSLDRIDWERHTTARVDRNAVAPEAFKRTLPLALIGRDGADGELTLPSPPGRSGLADDDGDGAVHVQWPRAARDPRFDTYQDTCAKTLKKLMGERGQLLPNPGWKLLPDDVARVLNIDRGPLLTVHPLGGCPMGDDFRSGVVNHLGQVFKCNQDQPDDVYNDLVVLDGSIVPTSLGINPALTISALALRAIEILSTKWHFSRGSGVGEVPVKRPTRSLVRPVLRKLGPPAAPVQTKVQLIERLGGEAILADGKNHHLELTLHSEPVALADLMSPIAAKRRIRYDPRQSALRVFNRAPSQIEDGPIPSDEAEARVAGTCCRSPLRLEAHATVGGTIDVLQPASTRWPWRLVTALPAWFRHRGLRDIVQRTAANIAGLAGPDDPSRPPLGIGKYVRHTFAMASRAGAVRTLDYTLQVSGFNVTGAPAATLFGTAASRPRADLEVRGRKTLTYDGRSSPWTQLMDLTLSKFPGMPRSRSATLSLDLPYLARQGVPLLRVVSQQDHVQALVDLASFNLYVLRTLVEGHAWTFRRPDRVPDRVIHRLPGSVRGLPPPEVTELKVAEVPVGQNKVEPVHLRLTRYRPRDPRLDRPPVLLIHGYSASGTTFVHPTLRPGLGGRLVEEKRDVWVLDLRSSAGMPGRTYPWTFEQIGLEDIPLAVDHIVGVCGKPVDIVAHCMGSAMLCMALLGDIPKDPAWHDKYAKLLEAMRGNIRRIVLSQVGPLVVMSPSNQLRAFLMRYVKQLIPGGEYRFRPDGDGSMADMLLDRLLATLPYPRDEFRKENPLWPLGTAPWVRTRRRMDILYGQVFNLTNMSRDTLEHLDDFFGPMNVETVSQVIHFTRARAITDAKGNHVFATRDRLRTLQRFPILSIHGKENCLADVSTADLLIRELDPSHYRAECFRDFGHQDCLIGKNTRKIFDTIVTFLDVPPSRREALPKPRPEPHRQSPAPGSPSPQPTDVPEKVLA